LGTHPIVFFFGHLFFNGSNFSQGGQGIWHNFFWEQTGGFCAEFLGTEVFEKSWYFGDTRGDLMGQKRVSPGGELCLRKLSGNMLG